MNINEINLLDNLVITTSKPKLFEQGEEKFWNDLYISKSMLAAHLNPKNDAASRKEETINKTVVNLLDNGFVKKGNKLLDLGCGPGLYSTKFASRGVNVTGIDISETSINYAIQYALKNNLCIDYQLMNFFNIDFKEEFDVAMQVYGELNVFSDNLRDDLISRVYKALKPNGLFIFDVSTRRLRKKVGLSNGWYMADKGFWTDKRHLVLEQGFDYPEDNVWCDQFTVITDDEIKVYRNWFHDYNIDDISKILKGKGFEVIIVWSNLTGEKFTENSDWIGIVAKKI